LKVLHINFKNGQMKINELNPLPDIGNSDKLTETYTQFEKLLIELGKRDLPEELIRTVNIDIEEINSTSVAGDKLRKKIKWIHARIVKLLEKEVKLVPKNYYQNLWLTLGMVTFGLPFGVVFGISFGNMAYLGIGLPIGMAIGIAVGSGMDKKAFEEGRQLDV